MSGLSPGRPGGTPADRVKDRSPTNPGPEKVDKVQKARGSQLVAAKERTEGAGGGPSRRALSWLTWEQWGTSESLNLETAWPYLCLHFAMTILVAIRTGREKRESET